MKKQDKDGWKKIPLWIFGMYAKMKWFKNAKMYAIEALF